MPNLTFEPIRPVRAYERVVHQIEEAIFRGDLAPGHRLPSERELMAQFSVSRATIREALRVLESGGVIRSRPGDPAGGAEVLPFSTEALRKSLNSLVKLRQVSLRELIQFRMITEGAACFLAALLRTDEQLERMRAAHASMREQVTDPERFGLADVEFHHAVSDSAGNALLRVCGDVARDIALDLIQVKLSEAPDSRARMVDMLDRHGAVLDAVAAGEAALAAWLIKRDLYDYYGEYADEESRLTLWSLVNADPQIVPD